MGNDSAIPRFTQLSFDDLEIWRDIPGYEGLYQASNKGRVRNVRKAAGCTVNRELVGRINKQGYRYATLSKHGSQKSEKIHRLVALAFLGPRPDGLQINHKNGIKTDNRVENVEYCTPRQNMIHSIQVLKRKSPCGEASSQARLKTAEVIEIKRLLAAGVRIAAIARQFHVCPTTIGFIAHGATWKDVHP